MGEHSRRSPSLTRQTRQWTFFNPRRGQLGRLPLPTSPDRSPDAALASGCLPKCAEPSASAVLHRCGAEPTILVDDDWDTGVTGRSAKRSEHIDAWIRRSAPAASQAYLIEKRTSVT